MTNQSKKNKKKTHKNGNKIPELSRLHQMQFGTRNHESPLPFHLHSYRYFFLREKKEC